MKKTLAAVAVAVLALTLTSCGSNDDAEASKALSDSIMKSQKSGDSAAQLLTLKQKEADCIGDGLVDKIGTDQLQEYKMLTKDLKPSKDVTEVKMSKGDATSATDVLFKCTDVPAMMQKAMKQSGQVPAEMQDCVNKALSEETLRGMFTHVFTGNEEQAQKDLIQPMMKCANPSGG